MNNKSVEFITKLFSYRLTMIFSGCDTDANCKKPGVCRNGRCHVPYPYKSNRLIDEKILLDIPYCLRVCSKAF